MAMANVINKENAIASRLTQAPHATTSAQIFAVVRASALTEDACVSRALSASIARSKPAAVVTAIAPFLAHASVLQDGWALNAKLGCNAPIQVAAVTALAQTGTVHAQQASAV